MILNWIIKNKREVTGLTFFLILFGTLNFTIFANRSVSKATVTLIPVLLKTAEGIKEGTLAYSHGVHVGSVISLIRVKLGKKGNVLSNLQAQKSPSYGLGIIAVLSLNKNFIFYPNYRIITKHRTVLSEKIFEILPGDSEDWDTKKLPGLPYIWPKSIDKSLSINNLELNYYELEKLKNTHELPQGKILLPASNYDDPLYLIATVIVENRANIFHLIKNTREITDKINDGTGSFSYFINRRELIDKTNATLEQSIYLINDARDGLEALRESDSTIRFGLLAFTLALASLSP